MKIHTSRNTVAKVTCAAMTVIFIGSSCQAPDTQHEQKVLNPLIGTWRLIEGRLQENGKTTVTPYTGDTSFIKIINPTHFAFLQHDSKKDSTGFFSAGGGHYSLRDSIYTEHLEYCNARSWEGHQFSFTVQIKGDTLIQSGIEKIDSLGVNRINTEIYVRVE